MANKVTIPVVFEGNSLDEIVLTESIQELVKNLSVENMQLLANKSRKPGINNKIQKFKNLM